MIGARLLGSVPVIGGAPVTWGNTSVGSAISEDMGGDYRTGSKFVVATSNTITKLVAYLDGLGTGVGAQVVKGVIYQGSASTTALTTLIGTTNAVTLADGQAAGWVDLPFASGVSCPASTYWLMLHTGAVSMAGRLYYINATANANGYVFDTYSDGPAASGGTVALATGSVAIYAST